MTTNDIFKYKSRYCTYPKCQFVVNRYKEPDNLYLGIIDAEDHSPICHCTVNTENKLSDDRIAVKDYSENEGMEDSLIHLGIINPDPVDVILSGFVAINVFELTDSGKELFKEVTDPSSKT